MTNANRAESAQKSQFLSFESMSFPTILAAITGFKAASVPIAYVIFIGIVGAVAILAVDVFKTEMPEQRDEKIKWWFARLSVWVFNTAIVIGSVVFLGAGTNGT